MSSVSVIDVATGALLDTVTLTDSGSLEYQIGNAKPIFDSKIRIRPDLSVEQIFAAFSDWSNGYVKISPQALTAAGPGDVQNLGMIALVPDAQSAERLTIPGYEPTEELHLTVIFLGDINAWTETMRTELVEKIQTISLGQSGFTVTGFGAAMWNPLGDNPCVVVNVGGRVLENVKGYLSSAFSEFSWNNWAVDWPEQRSPWIPHVTLAYTDDTGVIDEAILRLGPITFDRVRVEFGAQGIDIPLMPTNTMVSSAWEIESVSTLAETQVDTVEEITAPESELGTWEGILAIEGMPTGDGRMFAPGSLTWDVLPVSLQWTPASYGEHMGAVVSGRIDEIWRDEMEPGMIRGRGKFNLNDENGTKPYQLVQESYLQGISIDPDMISNTDIEIMYGPDEEPQMVIFHAGRIRAATLVAIPAFAEARVWLTDGTMDIPADKVADIPEPEIRETAPERSQDEDDGQMSGHSEALTAAGAPTDWFSDPGLTEPTPFTVTEDGRIFGHAALFGTCHIGVSNSCVRPPFEARHDFFMLGEALTASGDAVSVGTLTMDTGHAPVYGISAQQAVSHYDNTGTAVASVSVGNDAHGIWVAGAIRPGLSAEQIETLRGSVPSGDWRRIGGSLRLVAMLAVNVPGFPVPRLSSRVDDGRQLSLVASGVVTQGAIESAKVETHDRVALRSVADSLARRMGRDRRTLRTALGARMGKQV